MSGFEFDYNNSKLFIDGEEILSSQGVTASKVKVTPYNTLTASTLQEALQQLADQQFRSPSQPTGNNVEEGDLWFETDTQILYVYKQVSPSVFAWQPISSGTDDSDTLDGGLY